MKIFITFKVIDCSTQNEYKASGFLAKIFDIGDPVFDSSCTYVETIEDYKNKLSRSKKSKLKIRSNAYPDSITISEHSF